MTISNQVARQSFETVGGIFAHAFSFPVHAKTDVLVVLRNSTTGVEEEFTDPSDYSIVLSGSPLGSTGGTVTLVADPGTGNFLSVVLDPPRTQTTSLPATGKLDTEGIETTLDKFLNMIKRANDLGIRGLRLSDGAIQSDSSQIAWDALLGRIVNLSDPVEATDAANLQFVNAQILNAGLDLTTVISTQGADLIDETSFDDMLTKLGGLATGIALFKSSAAVNAMNNLGFDAFFQTLIVAASKGAFRGLIDAAEDTEIPAGNLIVNPDFQVWQTGTTFASAADNSYIADQWVILSDGTAVDIAKSVEFSPGSRGGVKITQRSGKDNVRWGVGTILENARVGPVANQKVSFSVDARAGGNNTLGVMSAFLIYWDGTLNQPNTNIVNSWAGAEVKPTLLGDWNYVTGGEVSMALSAGPWNTYSFEDITVPSDAVNLGILIVTMDSSFTGSGSGGQVEISKVNLVPGSVVRKFYSESKEKNMADCERFYCKTFAEGVVADDNVGVDNALFAYASGTSKVNVEFVFPVQMFKVPAVQEYNPYDSAPTGSFEDSTGLNVAPVQLGRSTKRVTLHGAGSGLSGKIMGLHADADARF